MAARPVEPSSRPRGSFPSADDRRRGRPRRRGRRPRARHRCSPPTAAGLFPMPVRTRRPVGWWSPDPRGVAPARRAAGQSRRCAGRAAATRSGSTPRSSDVIDACADPRRPGGWITEPRSSRRLRAAARARAGPTASRRGPTTASSSAACTASPSAGCSPASRCSTAATDASKVALVGLVDQLQRGGGRLTRLLDVQWATPTPRARSACSRGARGRRYLRRCSSEARWSAVADAWWRVQ